MRAHRIFLIFYMFFFSFRVVLIIRITRACRRYLILNLQKIQPLNQIRIYSTNSHLIQLNIYIKKKSEKIYFSRQYVESSFCFIQTGMLFPYHIIRPQSLKCNGSPVRKLQNALDQRPFNCSIYYSRES